MQALAQVYGPGRSEGTPLTVGSVKTNIGHLEAGAGVAGLIKLVLALQHRQIPPHLHFQRLNPHIDLSGFRAEIPTTLRPWKGIEGRHIGGLSSFGFSGTNVHVLVEAVTETVPAPALSAAVSVMPVGAGYASAGRAGRALPALF